MSISAPEVESRTQGSRPRIQKIRGQGQPFRGQTLSRPRIGMLEAKAKDTGSKCSSKKKVFKQIFQAISKKQSKKKGLQPNFSGDIQKKKRSSNKFSGELQNFNDSKNRAVFEPRTGCKVLYIARLVNARPNTRDFHSKRTPLIVEYRTRRL